jgi:DNA mismatch repair protein MutS
MRQYYRFKREHPGCLLLFRIGDFYETFDDDAVTISKAAGLTLTQRTEGVPMAGMPFHQLDTYVRRLIDQGYRVAVVDQIEDPAAARARAGAGAIIERAVTRVLTPGTLVDESLLQPESQATLAAVSFPDGGERPDSIAHAAIVDLSTGRFLLVDSPVAGLADELLRRSVSELLFTAGPDGNPPPRVRPVLSALGISGTPCPAWHFRTQEAHEIVREVFGVRSLGGFGLADDDAAVPAAGAILRYLRTTQPAQKATLAHLQPPKREDPGGWCVLDATSLRSLEVLSTLRGASAARPGAPGRSAPASADPSSGDGSLAGIFAPSKHFPGCRTPMGRRLLRDWLCRPLCDLDRIVARQRAVSTFVEDRRAAADLGAALAGVQDVSRICSRIALARATPRDLVALGRSLAQVQSLRAAVENAPALTAQRESLAGVEAALAPLAGEIARVCVDSPPPHLREGGLIRDGVDAELDQARLLRTDAGAWMAEYQARLIHEHDLPSLKVGFNKIFGYYIELPAAQARRAPDAFSRKQTLKNAERYITPELREFESKVTTAEARALQREQALFDDLCARCAHAVRSIHVFADACAELDVLLCFADKAVKRSWIAPRIVPEPALRIEQGRHPVLDEILENNFVPNDLSLGALAESPAAGAPADSAPLALITGPNMAGKSTFIRQTALLVLLAHCGCFVPASAATIGLTDRIFTRVGADDALHAGQSTFMVEMIETARILHHVTPRSLVVLDEIGRGTSTLDGLSLAWAIAETLAGASGVPAASTPRTLFATHYHELTDLEELLPGRVRNLQVAVREWGDDVVFLHRILPGRADQSYGIHVAKLAGLPAQTVARARAVLDSLAVHHALAPAADGPTGKARTPGRTPSPDSPLRVGPGAGQVPNSPPDGQLTLFTQYVQHPAVDALKELKLEALTPLQAFDELRRVKGVAEGAPSSPPGTRP